VFHRISPTLRYVPGALVALGLTLAPSIASAQTGWAVNRYEPSPAGDGFFAAERPWYRGARGGAGFRAGMTVDYSHNPLVVRTGGAQSSDTTAVISDMLVVHAQVGVGIAGRLGLHLSIPTSFWQNGTPDMRQNLAASSGPVLGDPRVGVRFRVAGDAERDPFSFHLGAMLFVNAGLLGMTRQDNVTDDSFRARFNVTTAGHAGIVRWSASLGYHLRPANAQAYSTVIGSDLFFTTGVSFSMLRDKLNVGPELAMSTVATHAFEWRHLNAEFLASARYTVADSVQLGVAVGPGLTQGAGTPAVRGLFNVSYAPDEQYDSDRDGLVDPQDHCPLIPQGDHPDPNRPGCPLNDDDLDGILNDVDQCPTIAQGSHPDPDRRGCPAADTDNDGVYDHDDQCVSVPQGDHPDPNRVGCPDRDDDEDGVFNATDRCPSEPAGAIPDATRPGCPASDRDHDTVIDIVDHCPDDFGAPSSDPLRNGCPGRVRVQDGQIVILDPVFFATNRDVIQPRSFPVLAAVADALHASPRIRRVVIEGHTDDRNTDEFNLDLSQRRANNVMSWLVQHGIEAERLIAQGFGEAIQLRPIAGLRGRPLEDARGMNRRVMFRITDPSPSRPNGTQGSGDAPQR